MKPTFLTLSEVIEIHKDQIRRYGRTEGIRDWGMLQSALAMPAAMFGGQYLHTDECEMAAAYLFHLVQNHPFIDCNKRVGAVAADVFLTLNNMRLQASEEDFEEMVMSVANGAMSKSAVAEFFGENTEPRQGSDEA